MAAADPPSGADGRPLRMAIFCAWLLLTGYLAWHHVFWRDEVRALSLAIRGDNVLDMWAGLHGEGHPALWYLLLRGAHALVGKPTVLPALALAIGAAAILLLALRAPFRWPIVALIAFSHFALFEYAVMARNYGISMLLMFLLAICYPRRGSNGVVLGILLMLLASTNVHSVLLVAAFLLFWLVDIVLEDGMRWTHALRMYGVNVLLAAVGIVTCIATVYPPFNDAAVIAKPGGVEPRLLIRTLLFPAEPFADLVLNFPAAVLAAAAPASSNYFSWLKWPMSLLMFGSTLGLVRSPGAWMASIVSLLALSILFTVVYQGGYRHEALWLVFLITLYWITLARGDQQHWRINARLEPAVRFLSATGWALLIVLLVLQLPYSFKAIADTAPGAAPNSQSREFAALLGTQPQLQDAIIIADPDYLVESLPYYLTNRIYLQREHHFGTVVSFTKQALLRLTLDEILENARRLHVQSGRPLVILMREKLNPADPTRIVREGYNWTLVTTPEQVRRFLDSTRLLMHAIAVNPDQTNDLESFEVFVLKTD
jgi:hypothetical protein